MNHTQADLATRTLYRVQGRTYQPDEWEVVDSPFDIFLKLFLIGRHGAPIEFLNERVNDERTSIRSR